MRIGLLGGRGQLGLAFAAAARQEGHVVHAPSRGDLDITDHDAVAGWVAANRCDVFVNCAAYTAVDAAETHRDLAYAVNADGAGILARAVDGIGARLVHVSTDFVFDGRKGLPYLEEDVPNPLNVYGCSKLAGEHLAIEGCGNLRIVRVGWLFGVSGRNFVRAIVEKALRGEQLAVVGDQVGGPTGAIQLSRIVLAFCESSFTGRKIVHAPGTPHVSWHEFAQAIVECAHGERLLRDKPEVRAVSSVDLGQTAVRPADSRLASSWIHELVGIRALDWRTELPTTVRALAAREQCNEGLP